MRLLIFLLSVLSAQAATIRFAITNSDLTPCTNTLRIFPITTPIRVDGSWDIRGVSSRLPLTNGVAAIRIAQGNYYATNTGYYKLFAVPSGNGTYDASYLEISGGNVYNYSPSNVVRAIGGGSNISVTTLSNGVFQIDVYGIMTSGGVTNAVVSFQGRTNAAAVLTGADVAGVGGTTNGGSATFSNVTANLYRYGNGSNLAGADTLYYPNGEPLADIDGRWYFGDGNVFADALGNLEYHSGGLFVDQDGAHYYHDGNVMADAVGNLSAKSISIFTTNGTPGQIYTGTNPATAKAVMKEDTGFSGSAPGLTNANASTLFGSGTVADRFLSTNVNFKFLSTYLAKIDAIVANGSGVANIVWIGDSWIAQDNISEPVGTYLRAKYGDAGAGFVSACLDGNSAISLGQIGVSVTTTGTWAFPYVKTNSTTAGLGYSFDVSTPASMTFIGICSTAVLHFITMPGGGTFRWHVDAGAWSTNSTAGTLSCATVTNSGLSDAGHSIVIQVVTAGTAGVNLGGLDLQRAGPGVRLHNLGRVGYAFSTWQTAQTAASWSPGLAALSPDLFLLSSGVNEALASMVPSDFAASCSNMVAEVHGIVPTADVVLVSAADIGAAEAYTMAAYVASEEAVSRINNWGFVNNYDVIGSYSNANARGLYANAYHPSPLGGAVLARGVLRFLGNGGSGAANRTNVVDLLTPATYVPNVGTFGGNLIEAGPGGAPTFVVDLLGNTTAGSFSSPGVGTNSEKFGAGATFLESIIGYSTVFGANAAAGSHGTAMGAGAIASDMNTIAFGAFANASSNGSIALGYGSIASGYSSTVIGDTASASGSQGIAIGSSVHSTGIQSVSLGVGSSANGKGSTAIGLSANASGAYSTAMGRSSVASAYQSTAVGGGQGVATNSTGIGYFAIAYHQYSTAVGQNSWTTDTNQVMLGTASGTVNIPGTLIVNNAVGSAFGLTNLQTTNLVGTVPDARLSTNVVMNGQTSVLFGNVTSSFVHVSEAVTITKALNPYLYLESNADPAYSAGLHVYYDGYHSMSLTGLNGKELLGQYDLNTLLPYGIVYARAIMATNGFSSDGVNFTMPETNAPVNGYVRTATGTGGAAKWAAPSGGNGPFTNGVVSSSRNLLAPVAITVTASPFNFTNSAAVGTGGTNNVYVFVDGSGVTGSVAINGTTIFSALAGADATIPLQPGEYITVTYSIGTPVMKWKPF